MKKILFVAALMLSSVSTFAQHAVGSFNLQPKVGVSIANLTEIKGSDRGSRYLVGVGIYFGKSKKKETFIYNSS